MRLISLQEIGLERVISYFDVRLLLRIYHIIREGESAAYPVFDFLSHFSHFSFVGWSWMAVDSLPPHPFFFW